MKVIKYLYRDDGGMSKDHIEDVMNKLPNDYSIEYINWDNTPNALKEYNPKGSPLCIIEEDGVEVDRLLGTTSVEQIVTAIEGDIHYQPYSKAGNPYITDPYWSAGQIPPFTKNA